METEWKWTWSWKAEWRRVSGQSQAKPSQASRYCQLSFGELPGCPRGRGPEWVTMHGRVSHFEQASNFLQVNKYTIPFVMSLPLLYSKTLGNGCAHFSSLLSHFPFHISHSLISKYSTKEIQIARLHAHVVVNVIIVMLSVCYSMMSYAILIFYYHASVHFGCQRHEIREVRPR
jgi:hypothetical protein